ncbi:Zinc finger BED domaincontaining protein 1like [Caligus rogercresseyi]|uniref:Zinc finger BED domaincontaining protein 1like n=1 Tax=Caligus rogercresseyi TaxID=217165 RepID=A0A7T8JUI0_CALRO|nr:Zinc finger BED domaincontaining protein 1like [Caligus rogercresseyi]
MASSELVAKKNANAPVWAHFGFRQDDKGEPTNLDEPLCRICNKKVAAKDSNTTNLKSHLKNSHPITYARLGLNAATTSSRASSADSGSGKKMQQPGIIGAFTKANVTKYPKGSSSPFEEDHTADNLAEGLESAVEKWGLNISKLAAITTDNASNIRLAISNLGWQWLNCFGHNLNVAITHGIAAKTGPTHRAIAECSTRWGTRLDMIESILEQAPAIRLVLNEDRKTKVTLNWSDVDVLTAMSAAVKPVSEFTDMLSAEKYVTSSSVLPLLNLCQQVLGAKDSDVQLTKDIKAVILEKLGAI